jgi:hypothetical protein
MNFFEILGFVGFCWMIVGVAVGVVFGIYQIYDYFVDLKSTLSRIENLINAEDYTGAEEINHG